MMGGPNKRESTTGRDVDRMREAQATCQIHRRNESDAHLHFTIARQLK